MLLLLKKVHYVYVCVHVWTFVWCISLAILCSEYWHHALWLLSLLDLLPAVQGLIISLSKCHQLWVPLLHYVLIFWHFSTLGLSVEYEFESFVSCNMWPDIELSQLVWNSCIKYLIHLTDNFLVIFFFWSVVVIPVNHGKHLVAVIEGDLRLLNHFKIIWKSTKLRVQVRRKSHYCCGVRPVTNLGGW